MGRPGGKKKPPCVAHGGFFMGRTPGPPRGATRRTSGRDLDVLGARTLGAGADLEGDALVFLKRLIAFATDFGVMGEKVFCLLYTSDAADE